MINFDLLFLWPADLNQMHKLNEEAYSNPEEWQRRTTAAKAARRADLPDPNERVCGTVAVCSIHVRNCAAFTAQ